LHSSAIQTNILFYNAAAGKRTPKTVLSAYLQYTACLSDQLQKKLVSAKGGGGTCTSTCSWEQTFLLWKEG
jgi:hypothetical protein